MDEPGVCALNDLRGFGRIDIVDVDGGIFS
jgi:hypothetical protein